MFGKWNKDGTLNWVDNVTVYSQTEVNPTIQEVMPPIGSIIAWAKTYNSKTTGTNDSTGSNLLLNSAETFITDGVLPGMIVYNSTDLTWAYVVLVYSETQLTLSADIFTSTGKTYFVYSTPRLRDGWAECNGGVLSDSDSIFNGATLPNLNGTSNQLFLRGGKVSGLTGGADTVTLDVSQMPPHAHGAHNASQASSGRGLGGGGYANDGGGITGGAGGGLAHNNIPAYYQIVWIMRVK
jgi:hypothetical protein